MSWRRWNWPISPQARRAVFANDHRQVSDACEQAEKMREDLEEGRFSQLFHMVEAAITVRAVGWLGTTFLPFAPTCCLASAMAFTT